MIFVQRFNSISTFLSFTQLGAGIGSVAKHFYPLCGQSVTLVDLDHDLVKILKHHFHGKANVEVIEDDALVVLKERNIDILFSNLPFFLTENILKILCDKVASSRSEIKDVNEGESSLSPRATTFRRAIICVHNDEDFSDMTKYPNLSISVLCVVNSEDFFPQQPFSSKVIVVEPRMPSE